MAVPGVSGQDRGRQFMKHRSLILLAPAFLQTSCVVVGYRGGEGGGGWFLWPGGLGLLVMILVAFLLLRRRR